MMKILCLASLLSVILSYKQINFKNRLKLKNNIKLRLSPNDLTEISSHVDVLMNQLQHNSLYIAEEAASIYSKSDKTGFIGFFATYIEIAIDFGNNLFNKIGIKNSYGYSIILFTLLIKTLTLPLTTSQLESTSKMQKLTPLQQKIQAKYPSKEDEQTKNQLLAQLFQAANVNPLAGCLPALVQIPIFISLYRALTNLVAENKLNEPFLWIPDLEGPVYSKPTSEAAEWIKSIVTGNPILGWHDTLAFLSLPFILYISQTISMKILQPPKDPNKILTEQEQFSQGLVNNLPFIVAFFAINVPAGLSVYWIINNILTTLITVAVKASIKDEVFPVEVERMMALLDSNGNSSMMKNKSNAPGSTVELQRKSLLMDDRPKVEGFGSSSLWNKDDNTTIVDAEIISNGNNNTSDNDDDDEDDDDNSNVDASKTEKRKKRVKPASKKSKKSRD